MYFYCPKLYFYLSVLMAMLPKDYNSFIHSLEAPEPDAIWPEALRAVWYEAKGNWIAAHDIAQEMHSPIGSWIHAYLHRKEGDKWNAGYWYGRANREYPENSYEEELEELVNYILR